MSLSLTHIYFQDYFVKEKLLHRHKSFIPKTLRFMKHMKSFVRICFSLASLLSHYLKFSGFSFSFRQYNNRKVLQYLLNYTERRIMFTWINRFLVLLGLDKMAHRWSRRNILFSTLQRNSWHDIIYSERELCNLV